MTQVVSKENLYIALAGGEEQIRQYAYQLESENLGLEQFSPTVFRLLIEAIQEPQCLNARGSWYLLLIFENDWVLLTDQQQTDLLAIIEKVYSQFIDETSWFVASEILGEYATKTDAFEILCRLRTSTKDEGPRSLIAHGLEHIARDSSDQHLAQRAHKVLLTMEQDPSELVQREAAISLQRISNQKSK